MYKKIMKMTVNFDNLTESQAEALEDLFATWMFLSEKKMSVWTGFFSGGAEDFHPEITVNGKSPDRSMKEIGNRLAEVKIKVSNFEDSKDKFYLIDYDKIEVATKKESVVD